MRLMKSAISTLGKDGKQWLNAGNCRSGTVAGAARLEELVKGAATFDALSVYPHQSRCFDRYERLPPLRTRTFISRRHRTGVLVQNIS